MDYINRINSIEQIKEDFINNSIIKEDKKFLCINSQPQFFNLTNKFKIEAKKKLFGSESNNSEIYKACMNETNKDFCLVVKQIPITTDFPDDLYSIQARGMSTCIELIVLELCNILVKESICPNLPISYGHFFCDSCVFSNSSTSKCALTISELADLGDGNIFFKTHYNYIIKHYRYEEVLSYILFQIYTALYTLQKYFNITHHDLHAGNILFISTTDSKDKYIMYTIDGNNYYVKNLGFIVVLWDFGFAMSPNKLFNRDLKDYYSNLKSINNRKIIPDWIQIPRLTVDYKRITSNIFERLNHSIDNSTHNLFNNTFMGFDKGVVINDIIKYYRMYYSKRNTCIYKFSLDKYLKIDDEDIKDLLRVNKFKDEKKNLKDETAMRLLYIDDNENIDIPFPHYENYAILN